MKAPLMVPWKTPPGLLPHREAPKGEKEATLNALNPIRAFNVRRT